jgi:molybdopterin converting factor subunit 1
MKIKIKFFASCREFAGVNETELPINKGQTVADVLTVLRQKFPRLSLSDTMTAVNQEFAAPNYILKDGDELAILPPVSGG